MHGLQLCSNIMKMSRISRLMTTRLPVSSSFHRFYSTETLNEKPVDPKIGSIVESISQLNLIETAALVDALKKKLNISDIAMPMMAAPSAGGANAAGTPGAGPSAGATEEEKPKEKTQFSVKLEKFDTASKAKIIREIKSLVPGMNLVEAKKFVEGAPKVIKDNVPKEEAEKMKKTLESLGATVKLE